MPCRASATMAPTSAAPHIAECYERKARSATVARRRPDARVVTATPRPASRTVKPTGWTRVGSPSCRKYLPPASLTIGLDIAQDAGGSTRRSSDRYERDPRHAGRVRESFWRQAAAGGWIVVDGERSQRGHRRAMSSVPAASRLASSKRPGLVTCTSIAVRPNSSHSGRLLRTKTEVSDGGAPRSCRRSGASLSFWVDLPSGSPRLHRPGRHRSRSVSGLNSRRRTRQAHACRARRTSHSPARGASSAKASRTFRWRCAAGRLVCVGVARTRRQAPGGWARHEMLCARSSA